ERVVVGLHTGELELMIVVLMKRARVIGKQNLGVDAVSIESFKALTRNVSLRGNFFPMLRIGIAQWIAHHGGAVAHSAGAERPAVDHPTLDFGAFGVDFFDLRDALAEFAFRHPAKKSGRFSDDVGVGANETEADFHLNSVIKKRPSMLI